MIPPTLVQSPPRRRGLLAAWLAAALLGAGLVLVTGPGLNAQTMPGAGSLDASFGTDGAAITNIYTPLASRSDFAYSVAVQSDGKIVAVGKSRDSNDDFAVVRYNTDGSLDTGFASNGKVTTAIGTGDDVARSVAVQSDGKIVVAGYSNNGSNDDFAVVRYNSNGSLDTSFDTDGKLTTAIGTGEDRAHSVAVQSDGKIVAAGYANNGHNDDFAVVRYNANGSLDTSFSSDGKVTTNVTGVGTGNDRAHSVAVQSDGKIVAAGYANNGHNLDFAVVRYNANGSLDTSFSSDGKLTTAVGSSIDIANSVVLQSDGKIVAAGRSFNASGYADFAVVRYNANGSLDTSFSSDGKVTTDISGDDVGRAVALSSDGKIVVAGNPAQHDFAVVRYSADGSLDTGFHSDGKVITRFEPDREGSGLGLSVAVQSDGKIVVVGEFDNGSNDDFAVVRYNADGSLDRSFGTHGRVTTAIGPGHDRAWGVAELSDGKLVVAGYSYNGSNDDFAVVRYNADGSLDTSFDTDGKVTTGIGTGEDRAFSMALQSDGKIVLAGRSHNGNNRDFAVVRYNADGSLDTSFDTDGKVTTAVGTGEDRAYSVAVQSDGKIVLGGRSHNGSNNDFAAVRYNADGSLDTSFDTDGKVTTALGTGTDEAWGVASQSDGKIVLAGYSYDGNDRHFAVVRYNVDGSLDTGFDSDGKVTTAFDSGRGFAYSVAVQPDGKIVAAGLAIVGSDQHFAVVRYNVDGSLDTGFGSDGKVTTGARPELQCCSAFERADAVTLQSDGRIVVAGHSRNANSDFDFAVVRLLGKAPPKRPVRRPVYTPPPPPPPPPPFELEVRRVGGADRFETSVLLAGEYAALAGRLDTVVLASGADFPDALSASALAGTLGAPLLYVGPHGLPEQVAEFIRGNGVAKVFIVGGEAAVSAEVQTAAESLEPVREVTRISGADRYGTSVEVASRVAQSGVGGWCGGAKTVLLASGEGFADALSASPAAAAGPHPLLLSESGSLPDTVTAWLAAAADAGTVEQVVIVGGTAAVSSAVESSITSMGLATVRIAGADRYSTSALFARRTECVAKNHLAAATGVVHADGLTAGPLLARLGGALVLVQPDAVPNSVSNYAAITLRFRRTTGSTLWILGGRDAVSNAVLSGLRDTIRDANTR